MSLPARSVSVVPGANSTTFRPLPVDSRLTIPEVFAHQARQSSSHNLFVYADGNRIEKIAYFQAYGAQLKAARIVKQAVQSSASLYSSLAERPVIGILSVSDSITYSTLSLGIMQASGLAIVTADYLTRSQAGAIPFPISTRNSAIAVAHLVRSTNTHQVFVSDDLSMQSIFKEATELLAKDGFAAQIIAMPQFNGLYNNDAVPEETEIRLWESTHNDTCLILHSSGTSSFPKPIRISHKVLQGFGANLYFGEVDVCGIRLGIHSLPMFHAIGVSTLSWALFNGLELATFKPQSPPVVPNAASLLEGLIRSQSEWIMTVPALVEEWSHDPASVKTLKSQIKRICFGGGPLNRQAGDLLADQGIFIESFYGLTETGSITKLSINESSRDAKDWVWFPMASPEQVSIELVPHPENEGMLEPVVIATEYFAPCTINTQVDGKPGFATGDLIQPHPTMKGFYKVYGRIDEQIMLSTGEKTNPVPLERILNQDSHISISLFFGRGRFNNGVLIQPTYPFDPRDHEKLARFREVIWPTVQKMNAYAPSHSRLLKEMIIVADPTKPLELTAKGSARRNVCLAKYEHEIEELYKAAGEAAEDAPHPPTDWTLEASLEYVHALVRAIIGQPLGETEDLFQHGFDSLSAVWIRKNVLRALRGASATVSLAQIPQTFVYQYPSIRALSDYIHSVATGRDLEHDEEEVIARRLTAMQSMVVRYSANFSPLRPSSGPAPDKETVVVSGTTGRLGCHLLERLIRDSAVGHVYALNRGSARDTDPAAALLARQKVAFEKWGMDPELLGSGKVTILASDYAKERLGLDPATYAGIESSVTTIIHNAWRVDFNVNLSGFEPLIAGVRRIIDLAANAPVPSGARVLFVSSVSVLFRHPTDAPALEQPIKDPRISAGMGYGESKWVSETILLNAREQVGLRSGVVRVGQVSGDTRIGGWNKQEWVGAIAKASQLVGALPSRGSEAVSWVPVDIVAAALIEMARSNEPVLHLNAPKPATWDTIFGAFARGLGLPLIPYDEWVARVSAAAEANTREEHVSAFALTDFFKKAHFGEDAVMALDRSMKTSSTLAHMTPLGEQDAMRYLEYWRRIGHLNA
ncbi:acetyl-CoA synthetase-like protein [Vararia minispora EC-137]|uniref:Acetyl-CoA synthetase-like protein n=1 Tax=Vararia minispora EC-137 TaxID=1314806 RepID=A0ACB8QIN8_9AGAM|nr:acetyl-CoA synthetase-like protein [Vararia minispora EC-137]